MHGLILAGGQGTRLAQDGVADPKVTVEIAGRAQLLWLVEALAEGGCRSITVLVRRHVTSARELLAGMSLPVPLHLEACETPSSLHTLALGVARAPSGPLLVALGDTVMRPSDWASVSLAAHRVVATGHAGALVVTPFAPDDHPLNVTVDEHRMVREVGGPAGDPHLVTAGTYVVGERLRLTVPGALQSGFTRLRQLLRHWVASGNAIEALSVERAIDLDRREDLLAAEALLNQDVA